ncbi:MAG: (2Fe-2S)-binding protein [Planctomycetota bacterium]
MNDDQDLCLCFHVSTRKVRQFIRVRKPIKVSQLSECYGAGTGCGWCRKILERMLADETAASRIDHTEYRDARAKYRKVT